MANHVNSYITFPQINDAAKAELTRLLGHDDLDDHLINVVEDIKEEKVPPADGERFRWYCDNVGAKWCYVEDYDTEYDPYISMTSAWNQPDEFFQLLGEHLSKFDQDIQMAMTFEDEMPNFVGVSYYETKYGFDQDHIDSDEYQSLLGVSLDMDEICEQYDIDPDDDDAVWEKRDEISEMFWESWHVQSQQWIKQHFEDTVNEEE